MNSVSTQCAQKIYDKIGGKKPFKFLKKVYRKIKKLESENDEERKNILFGFYSGVGSNTYFAYTL